MTRYTQDRPRLFPRLGRTLLLGLLLIPIICGLSFGLMVVSTQAMFGAQQPGFEHAVVALLVQGGVLPAPTATTTAIPATQPPSPAPFELQPLMTNPPPWDPAGLLPPTMEPSLTPTASDTPAPTGTPTPSQTSSPTPSPSPTATFTATLTATASLTPSLTPTSTRTPSTTPWPTWTSSPVPQPTATQPPTDTPVPTLTYTPGGPTDTPAPTSPPSDTPTPNPSSCTINYNSGYENTIEGLINEARQDNGLSPLSPQSQLRAAARVHAADMACNGFTGHTGSDGSSVRDRVEAQGYSWSWIGENYMVTGSGPTAAFNWWMNSTPHRNNILGASYTEFGVGFVSSPDAQFGGYYVVVFARPG